MLKFVLLSGVGAPSTSGDKVWLLGGGGGAPTTACTSLALITVPWRCLDARCRLRWEGTLLTLPSYLVNLKRVCFRLMFDPLAALPSGLTLRITFFLVHSAEPGGCV